MDKLTDIYNDLKTVEIPASDQHEGFYRIKVTLRWICPKCHGPRGSIENVRSFDGSLSMVVNGWSNPCGHIDKYSEVREEAKINGLNNRGPLYKELFIPSDQDPER